MPKLCPKCGSLPSVLNEEQNGLIQFDILGSGKVSEKGEIQDSEPSGVVSGVCSKCDHEWVIKSIHQVFEYNS